ncbi:hypothetical protein LB465_15470 [Salegentibacter sp. LM13S]|uniref:hypothetical protein n=1 Tax=Salegentibacter lacus TaxID=2873599 RepID=UPI001CCA5C20|nr:hypothetical protein [Salegentibacter lacus]MBZ9632181.1 hypothetical protein [Salegentibacter lacus]
MIFKIRFLLFTLIIVVFSCSKKDNCTSNKINITSLENEYGCPDIRYSDVDIEENYLIISNQESFEELNMVSCTPEINFSKYDLIIGKKSLSQGNQSINYELSKSCVTQNLILKVIFTQNEAAVALTVTYHVLIPKLENQQIISVELEEQ